MENQDELDIDGCLKIMQYYDPFAGCSDCELICDLSKSEMIQYCKDNCPGYFEKYSKLNRGSGSTHQPLVLGRLSSTFGSSSLGYGNVNVPQSTIDYIPIVIAVLVTLLLVCVGVILFLVCKWRRQRRKYHNNSFLSCEKVSVADRKSCSSPSDAARSNSESSGHGSLPNDFGPSDPLIQEKPHSWQGGGQVAQLHPVELRRV